MSAQFSVAHRSLTKASRGEQKKFKSLYFEDFSKTGIAIEKLRDGIRVQSMRHILVVKLLGDFNIFQKLGSIFGGI